MKRYETKEINFEGCHPVIAEHLKKGLAVKCKCSRGVNGMSGKCFVVGYKVGDRYEYKTPIGSGFAWAEPIETRTETRVKKPVELMQALVDGGFAVDKDGGWNRSGRQSLTASMWVHAGNNVGGEADSWTWEPEWLEEVEI